MSITLHPTGEPQCYRARLTAKGSGLPALDVTVEGPGAPWPPEQRPAGWIVTTDEELIFGSLKEARGYLNRFFENADPEESK